MQHASNIRTFDKEGELNKCVSIKCHGEKTQCMKLFPFSEQKGCVFFRNISTQQIPTESSHNCDEVINYHNGVHTDKVNFSDNNNNNNNK